MTRINDLETISGSTATNSTYIWAVWNGKDYKIPLADIGRYIGRNPGVCVTRAGGTPANVTSGQVVPWANTFWDYMGWWNASSVGILQVKDDKYTHVDMKVQFSWLNNSAERYIQLRKNGTLVESGMGQTARDMSTGYPMQWAYTMNRLPVSSGDIFDWYVNQGTTTNTLEANVITYWQITPAEYK